MIPLVEEDLRYGFGLQVAAASAEKAPPSSESAEKDSENAQEAVVAALAVAGNAGDDSALAVARREAHFPTGLLDHNGSQVDLRRTNSWRLNIDEVSTPEVAEVMAINALAPFILNSRLVPLMRIRRTLRPSCDGDGDSGEGGGGGGTPTLLPEPRFIVNVR